MYLFTCTHVYVHNVCMYMYARIHVQCTHMPTHNVCIGSMHNVCMCTIACSYVYVLRHVDVY